MPRITTDHLDTSNDEAAFAFWWFAEGSGIAPLAGDDMEDHAPAPPWQQDQPAAEGAVNGC
jgi:hypothetical protein